MRHLLLLKRLIPSLRVSHRPCLLYLSTSSQNSQQKPSNLNSLTLENERKFILTGNKRVDQSLDRIIQKLFELMGIYEEMIGLKELKQAQQSVIEAEQKFIEAQETRRALSKRLLEIQVKLKELRDQMDRLNRTDTIYLKLFTQEHENLNEEKMVLSDYRLRESEERDLFYRLSTLLRESQEKERARAERIKYLQLALSIICTFLGLFSALLISYLRKSEIKEILNYEKESFNDLAFKIDNLNKEKMPLIDELSKNINEFKQVIESRSGIYTQLALKLDSFQNDKDSSGGINNDFKKNFKEIMENEANLFSKLTRHIDINHREQFESNKNLKELILNTNNINLTKIIENTKQLTGLNDYLTKQNRVISDNLNQIKSFFDKPNIQVATNGNDMHVNSFNEIYLTKKLDKQQELLKIISITTVLSSLLLCFVYFKTN